MTVSMLDSFLERMPKYRNERIIDMSQATIYAQVTDDSRQKLWNGWYSVIARVNAQAIHRDAMALRENPITWNGQRVSIKGLIRKFAQTFGKSGVGKQ